MQQGCASANDRAETMHDGDADVSAPLPSLGKSSRRRVLRLLSMGAVVLPVSGGAGFFFTTTTETGLLSSAAAATYGTSVVLTATVATSAASGTVTF